MSTKEGISYEEVQQALLHLAISRSEGEPPTQEEIALEKGLYSQAAGMHQGGQYGKAADLFRFLSGLNPEHAEYWRCLGICEQRQERFLEAAGAYTYAAMNDSEDPRIWQCLAACQISLGDIDSARVCLDKVEKIYNEADIPDNDVLRGRLQLMRRGCDMTEQQAKGENHE